MLLGAADENVCKRLGNIELYKSLTMKPVIVMRYSAMGDVAIACEVVKRMCKRYPRQAFIFMTDERYAQLAPKCNNLTTKAIRIKEYKGVPMIMGLGFTIAKQYEFDKVIDLNDTIRTKLIRMALRLKNKKVFVVNKHRIQCFIKFHFQSKRQLKLRHTAEMMADAITYAGYPLSINDIEFNDKTTSNGIIKSQQTEQINIGIACFSSKRNKEYPKELLVQLIDMLQNNSNIRVSVFGKGQRETEIGNELSKLTNCMSCINEDDMQSDIDNIRNMNLMICVDTGWMHIASLIGKPVISLWGPTQPSCGYYPLHQARDIAVTLSMPCSPCSVYGKKACRYNNVKCMEIPVEMVYKNVMKYIADNIRK